MAYNNGFPMTYQQLYPQQYANYMQPQVVNQQQQANDSDIHWVQGEAGAKSWLVAPGKSVMLMDSESNTFYIKSSDNSGMPMPLRIFDYTERTNTQQTVSVVQEQPDLSNFVTKEELDRRLNSILNRTKPEIIGEVTIDG